MYWTKKEIQQLTRYEEINNELAIIPEEIRSTGDKIISERLYLESILLIQNKYVIGYVNTKISGLYSFKEAMDREEYFIKQGKIFTYHPINFRSFEHQRKHFKELG